MFKFIGHHWQRRCERFYRKNRWHLVVDFSLSIIIILLVAALISLRYYHPGVNTNSIPTPEKAELDLNNPPLVLNFSIASSSVRLADGAEVKINLKNTSTWPLQNIKSSLQTLDKNFSINKITSENKSDNITIKDSEIEFGSLGAGEEKAIMLKVFFNDKSETGRVIKWQAENEYTVQGQSIKWELNLPDVILAAELNASAVIYYTSPQGDQLGSGPLPPVIGLPTNYWVFFEIKSQGDFKNLVFSARLPKGVELTDRRSLLAGDFKYNVASRQIIWTVPEIKSSSDNYRVGFQIQFLPTSSQLGKNATLVNGLNYYAIDALTGEEVSSALNALTTNLDFDRLNKGQGEIAQP